jgi:hypothetical protein
VIVKTLLVATAVAITLMFGLASSAKANDTTPQAWALNWQRVMSVNWDTWSTNYMMLHEDARVMTNSNLFLLDASDDLTDEEWLEYGATFKGIALKYHDRAVILWHRIVCPRVVSCQSWLPLAEWIAWHDSKCQNTCGDAKKLIRQVQLLYGSRPHFAHPQSTLTKLYYKWFCTHRHAKALLVTIEVSCGG